MASIREELHTLIDQLPESKLERLLEHLREETSHDRSEEMLQWLEGAKQLREALYAEHGRFFNSADVLNEIREERLNDLMGGE